ncbi:MAG: Arc family DNA-binding protein [Betaproteobacteria bacterium]|nr:Arc family DNA-binding protein [Betaproteobacteria bacterium]
MPVTLTIKQVPDRVADKLRLRAAASHRSLQGELMAILEEAVLQGAPQARQPEPPPYEVKQPAKPASKAVPAHGKRLTLGELWERARRLGPPSKSGSAAIVRKLRDERYGR